MVSARVGFVCRRQEGGIEVSQRQDFVTWSERISGVILHAVSEEAEGDISGCEGTIERVAESEVTGLSRSTGNLHVSSGGSGNDQFLILVHDGINVEHLACRGCERDVEVAGLIQ